MNKHKNPVDIESYKKGYEDACEMHNHNGFDECCKGELEAEIKEYREAEKEPEISQELITVCDKCFRACCWQGEFMCDDAKTAGTVEKTIKELSELSLENPCYWQQSA